MQTCLLKLHKCLWTSPSNPYVLFEHTQSRAKNKTRVCSVVCSEMLPHKIRGQNSSKNEQTLHLFEHMECALKQQSRSRLQSLHHSSVKKCVLLVMCLLGNIQREVHEPQPMFSNCFWEGCSSKSLSYSVRLSVLMIIITINSSFMFCI